MAPPPNPNLPLQERLLALAKTLQFGWFVGHLTLILTTGRYFLSWIRMNYYTRMAQLSYRTAFIAAAVTYGIVVYKTMRARAKTGARAAPSPMALLADENIQYLAMALPAPEAADGASPSRQAVNSPLANQIGAFVKEYYDASMAIVSSLEIALWGRILLSAILFQRRSWILIVLYTAFLRARYSQSVHVQNSFTQLGARVDSLVSAQGTPPAARQVWQGVKEAGKQFHDATDVSKYISGPAKKTS
ncbi:Nucleoporin POM33 [Fusarium oxysporum f. sp. rapae]|uniref:Nucleoporin POM33 n=1 Tax=Fusarium oxysporum f. sp. rapae TaxID=485398 RepID=A0A8J5NSJ2_FUSOX|nr:Nucleoporin POM33 [Fusarium oxysporum f. sp. rapae]